MVTAATVKGRVISELMQETMNYVTALEKENSELREQIEELKENPIPPILSINFIKDYTGVSAGTISDWLITGELKGTKKGGRWLIKREAFLDWLNKDEPISVAR